MILIDLQCDMWMWLQIGDIVLFDVFVMCVGFVVYENIYCVQLIDCFEMSFLVMFDWLGYVVFWFVVVYYVDMVLFSSWILDVYFCYFLVMLGCFYFDDVEVVEFLMFEFVLVELFVVVDVDVFDVVWLVGVDWDWVVLWFVLLFDIYVVISNVLVIWFVIIDGD